MPAMMIAALLAAAAIDVHPAGPSVPENLLRIELRFPTPAAAPPLPFDTAQLRLVDASGGVIDNALLDLALPDATGRRITVLLDPGRVKQGVGPNLDAGRALHAGQTVRLQLAGRTIKQWQVGPAAEHPLRVDTWRLSAPRAGRRDALVVDLGAPISGSGERLIAVVDAAGRRVEGSSALAEGDTVWRFMPRRAWRHRVHQLVASPQLEDPAGNRPCAAFETQQLSAARCEAPPRLSFTP